MEDFEQQWKSFFTDEDYQKGFEFVDRFLKEMDIEIDKKSLKIELVYYYLFINSIQLLLTSGVWISELHSILNYLGKDLDGEEDEGFEEVKE